MQQNKFQLWAIVELFGHQRIAGEVTEQSIGVATFIRVDVAATKTQPSFSRLLNPSAIYAINPVTEEVAKATAERIESKPIEAWDIREMQKKLMLVVENNRTEKGVIPEGDDDEDYREDQHV